MNWTIAKSQIPKLSLVLLVLLLALAPYAMSLPPYGAIYTAGVWNTQDTTDPLYPQRIVLVLLGLASAIIAFGEFMGSLGCSLRLSD